MLEIKNDFFVIEIYSDLFTSYFLVRAQNLVPCLFLKKKNLRQKASLLPTYLK